MRWGSAISRDADASDAAREVLAGARAALCGEPADVALAFFSPHHTARLGAALAHLARELPVAATIACSAQSCIGGAVEVEDGPSFSLTLGRTPGASFRPFRVPADAVWDADGAPSRLADCVGLEPSDARGFVLLGDPLSGDAEVLLAGLARAYPGAVQIGGLASGAQAPGAHRLAIGAEIFADGYVGLAATGDVAIDSVVAQGCRPIGQPMFVTRCDRNVVFELDGRPPLEILDELVAGASERELSLFRTSLFVGLQIDPARAELGRGDFLVRNLIGGDRDSGAIVVGALVRERQVVQFQLRDGATASEDLTLRLAAYASTHAAPSVALLFSCLGRGRAMYGTPNHDSDALRRHLGDVPVAGFFCNGEIGPVEGTPFLHGYTSAIALIRPRA